MADSVAPTMTKAGAVAQRVALGQRLRLFFNRYGLLLSPTMPIPAKKSPALPILPSRSRYRKVRAYEGGKNGEQGAEAEDPRG